MEKYSNLFALYARFLLCLSLFWHAGFNIAVWNLQIAVLTHLTQSFTAPILSATTAAEIVLGIAILIGYLTRHIACLAALYTLLNAFLMHSFWSSDPGTQVNDAMNFFQSIGLAGGFLMLAAFGPGEFSADAKLKEPALKTEQTPETKA
jgi:putative oxidoreductase